MSEKVKAALALMKKEPLRKWLESKEEGTLVGREGHPRESLLATYLKETGGFDTVHIGSPWTMERFEVDGEKGELSSFMTALERSLDDNDCYGKFTYIEIPVADYNENTQSDIEDEQSSTGYSRSMISKEQALMALGALEGEQKTAPEDLSEEDGKVVLPPDPAELEPLKFKVGETLRFPNGKSAKVLSVSDPEATHKWQQLRVFGHGLKRELTITALKVRMGTHIQPLMRHKEMPL